jgi:sulfopyruvate decarboxylase alpha subunit
MNEQHVAAPTKWQDEVFDLLRRGGVTQFAYVPDAGHTILIDRSLADPDVHSIALTTEEEGVALIAGADLGGARGVLLMQSSGVGNCINMLSLISACRFPFLTFITMRGEWAEFNPWQVPMSQATEPVLTAMGVKVYRVDKAEDVADTAQAAADLAFGGDLAVAVLLSQKMIGRKVWVK